jgi:phosphate transport system permease protein
MSERYSTQLVDGGGTTYEQFAIGVLVGSFVTFALAIGTFFGWVPLAEAINGTVASRYFGGVVLLLALATGALGGLSRWGGVETTPSRSAGLVVGAVQGLIWLLVTGLLLANTVGLGALAWPIAVAVGVGVGYLVIALREDIGATLPTALFVGFCGVLFLTGILTPTWTWEPDAFSATIPGTLVIPLLTMFSVLLTGWASASAHEGYGTRGRQNGAFVLISLVVLLTLSVLLFLLVFVFQRGIGAVTKNLTLNVGSAVVVVAIALWVVVRSNALNPKGADGTDKILAFISLTTAALLSILVVALLGLVVLGATVTGSSITVQPTAVVGAVTGLVVSLLLIAFTRSAGRWVPETDRGENVKRAFDAALGFTALLAIAESFVGAELAVGGVGIAPALLGLLALGTAVVAGIRFSANEETPLPPVRWLARFGVFIFLVASLRVFLTGYPIGTETVGIAANGMVDWPFIMNPSQGLGIQLGVMPAMFGTIWIVLGAVLFAVPLAIGSAVYLTEYAEDSLFTQAVDIATNGLWSTPSIVFGLFGLAFILPRFGDTPSIFAAQLVLGFMLLPLVLITSREAMKSVPDEYRDASAALGVSKWQTIRSVVIPASMPGVITGVILGVGRIAGETAPLLLVLNGANFPNAGPNVLKSFSVTVTFGPPFIQVSNPVLLERASALPYQLYAIITAGVGADSSFGWGTALVLLGVVLGFFAMSVATRRYFRRKLHQ